MADLEELQKAFEQLEKNCEEIAKKSEDLDKKDFIDRNKIGVQKPTVIPKDYYFDLIGIDPMAGKPNNISEQEYQEQLNAVRGFYLVQEDLMNKIEEELNNV